MKKYISLLSFIAIFFVGMQFSSAQDSNRLVEAEMPEAIAKQKTHELHQLVPLTGEQQNQVFKLLVDAESNLAAIKTEGEDIQVVQKIKAAILENTNARMKAILTPEQYGAYQKTLMKEIKEKK